MTFGLAGVLPRGCQPLRLDLRQTPGRITELRQVNPELVEQGQVEAAHLPVWFVQIIEDTASPNLSTPSGKAQGSSSDV